MMTVNTEDPVAVAVVAAIHTGDLTTLRRLLSEHRALATTRPGDDDPSSSGLWRYACSTAAPI